MVNYLIIFGPPFQITLYCIFIVLYHIILYLINAITLYLINFQCFKTRGRIFTTDKVFLNTFLGGIHFNIYFNVPISFKHSVFYIPFLPNIQLYIIGELKSEAPKKIIGNPKIPE